MQAAIEYEMKASEPAKVSSDNNNAKEAMSDMPPRRESELDPTTLHNQVRPLMCGFDSNSFNLSYSVPLLSLDHQTTRTLICLALTLPD